MDTSVGIDLDGDGIGSLIAQRGQGDGLGSQNGKLVGRVRFDQEAFGVEGEIRGGIDGNGLVDAPGSEAGIVQVHPGGAVVGLKFIAVGVEGHPEGPELPDGPVFDLVEQSRDLLGHVADPGPALSPGADAQGDFFNNYNYKNFIFTF